MNDKNNKTTKQHFIFTLLGVKLLFILDYTREHYCIRNSLLTPRNKNVVLLFVVLLQEARSVFITHVALVKKDSPRYSYNYDNNEKQNVKNIF